MSLRCFRSHKANKTSSQATTGFRINSFVSFLGWFHPFMSCSSVQNKIFHSRGFEASTISFFTWKRAQEKIFFFSPIIFLLLGTFTKYNFKMPTSEHFFFSIFFSSSHQTFPSSVLLVREISFFSIFFDDKCKLADLGFKWTFFSSFFSHLRPIRSALWHN